MSTDSIKYLTEKILAYRDERDWKQFHTPKNLAANLAVEVGELLGHYRWQDKPDRPAAAAEEVADIFYTLALFCAAEGIDLGTEVMQKLAKNADKYPVEKFKGSPKKYNEA